MLSDFRPAGADFTAWRTLPLQELVLIHCHSLEAELFVPGALLSLRRLRIEDSKKSMCLSRKQLKLMEKLLVSSRSLLRLPHLVQLPGSGVLFTSAVKDVLET